MTLHSVIIADDSATCNIADLCVQLKDSTARSLNQYKTSHPDVGLNSNECLSSNVTKHNLSEHLARVNSENFACFWYGHGKQHSFIVGDEEIVTTTENHYIFSKGRLIMEWHGIDSQTGTSVRYSQEGILLNTTRWEEGRKVWEEKFEYTDKFLSGSVAREVVTGEKTSRKYDSAGNITYQEDTVDDEVVYKMFCFYDKDSHLIDKTEVQNNLMERSRYRYENDRMVQEEQYKNGKLIRIINYASAENYTIDTYIDNVPVLRNYYIKHRKVKKEEWEKQGIGG